MPGAYCSQCGAEVSAGDKFCSRCGHSTGGENLAAPESPTTPTERPKRSWRAKLTLGCLGSLGLLFIFIVCVSALLNYAEDDEAQTEPQAIESSPVPTAQPGPSPESPATVSPVPNLRGSAPQSEAVILNDPSELVFSIQDFPSGWQVADQGAKDEGYEIRAVKLGSTLGTLEKVVVSWVRVYSDREAATEGYLESKGGFVGQFRLDDPSIGDESFSYEGNATFEVVFRTQNVLAETSMFSAYGGSNGEVKQWAEDLKTKIDREKRLGTTEP